MKRIGEISGRYDEIRITVSGKCGRYVRTFFCWLGKSEENF